MRGTFPSVLTDLWELAIISSNFTRALLVTIHSVNGNHTLSHRRPGCKKYTQQLRTPIISSRAAAAGRETSSLPLLVKYFQKVGRWARIFLIFYPCHRRGRGQPDNNDNHATLRFTS